MNEIHYMSDSKRLQQLDLNLLKVFRALYEEQNMTTAAEVLSITPSAVSHAIARLRTGLGDPLFTRSRNKMVPTPACRRMAPLIIDNLSRLQQMLHDWGDFEPRSSKQHFRIGMHDAFEVSVVPQLSYYLRHQAPHTSFSSVKVSRANMQRDLANGHVDMVIDVAVPTPMSVHRQSLSESEFVVLMRHDHPLVGTLDQANYLASHHLSVSNRPSGMTAEDSFFFNLGLERKIDIRCQNYSAAVAVAKGSDQLLTVPRSLAAQLIDEKVAVCALPINIPTMTTNLYWHEQTNDDAALSWLRRAVIKELDLLRV